MNDFIDLFGESPLVWWILSAEAAFWILLLGGLAARYLLRARRLSTVLLLAVPLVDVALLVLTAVDLSTGIEPNFSHVLATLYLAITVAFGHPIIRRTDAWFAWRFAGAPRPQPHPKRGPAHVRRMWGEWLRVVLAAVIASTGIAVLAWVSGTPLPGSIDRMWDAPLWSVVARIGAIVVVWFLAGPVYAVLFQSHDDDDAASTSEPRPAPRHHGSPPNGAETDATRP